MSLVLDKTKTQTSLLKKRHRLNQERLRLRGIEKIQKGLQDILVTEGHDLEGGTEEHVLTHGTYVEEETEYLCFRCYHNLVKFWKVLSFGPKLYYCPNDDCLAGSFYEHEAIEMTRRIYRDV